MRLGESGSITVKALIVGAVGLVLIIPLTMLRGLVSERSVLREQAYARVAEGWGGNITVGGPMLIIPTEHSIVEKDVTRVVRSEVYVLPSRLDIGAELKLEKEPRYVGIYATPVYLADIQLEGEFDLSAARPMLSKGGVTYLWNESRLRLPLSRTRSLREIHEASFVKQAVELGPAGPGVYRGVEASVDLTELVRSVAAPFAFKFVVAGSRDLSVLPLGSTTSVRLRADWPHPSFQGAFLPVDRSIDEQGFNARWQVLELNRSYRQVWWAHEVNEATLTESAFGVGLHQTVDVYQRGERAIKYALLFIALTFLTFFAWEHVTHMRLHPMQYLLVGLALSTFYLLLIALSEHVVFLAAYCVAATALVLLIGAYMAGALRNSRRGYTVGAAMTAVYGLLYVLVLSEDYALVLGAVVLFTALAAVMLMTRKIDWYRLSSQTSEDA